MNEKKRMMKVRPKHGGPWLVVNPEHLADSLDGASEDDYEIGEVFMTEAEADALPEFEGW
jgi:hypothetical protein